MRQDTGVDGDAQRISQLCWMFFLKIIDDQDQELELLKDVYRSPIPDRLQWRAWAADPEGITGEDLLTFINGDLFPTLKDLPVTGPRARTVRDVFEDAYNYMKSGQLMRQVINRINGIDFNNLTERQHFGDIYEQILNDLQSAANAGEYYTPRAVTAFMVQMTDPKPGETLFDPACGTGGFLTCAIRHMREHYVKRPEDEATLQTSLRAVEKKQLPHMLAVTNMLCTGSRTRPSCATTTRSPAPTSPGARTSGWTSSSPTRPSAGARRTGSSRTSPSISAPARPPTSSSR
jgi:type I restriction enzyme M protein